MERPERSPDYRYGCWAGNKNGVAQEQGRCVTEVMGGGFDIIGRQCSRPRGHGFGGLYCKQHAKLNPPSLEGGGA